MKDKERITFVRFAISNAKLQHEKFSEEKNILYIYIYIKKRRVKHEFSSVAKRTYEYKYIKATVTIKRIGGRGDRRSKPT